MHPLPTRNHSTEPAETSSAPIPIPKEQYALFHAVLTLFEQGRISYAVAGAFALQVHTGIGGDTKDLDVFLTARNAQSTVSYLAEHGFSCEVCDPCGSTKFITGHSLWI